METEDHLLENYLIACLGNEIMTGLTTSEQGTAVFKDTSDYEGALSPIFLTASQGLLRTRFIHGIWALQRTPLSSGGLWNDTGRPILCSFCWDTLGQLCL